ncbi:MAG TPA: lipopolysaccharide core heptose(I) kinase RfaP [Gammaproteobacteria bacterium]|nr:lipopolysaccharide core heptose(I) kinase RfaP [Gammaproteobacteria bacterium]
MKLAFCLFRYFPFGGLQRDFLRIAEECIKRGHTVDVYCMDWEGEKDARFSITIIPAKGWQNHTRIGSFAAQLQSCLNREKYDLIVGFNKMPGLDVYYAADACFQAKAREKHGFWYRLMPRYRHLLRFEKAVFSAEVSTQILLISKAEQPKFMQYYSTSPERFHLLPPGINQDRIAPSHALEIRTHTRQEFNIQEDEFLVLLIGSGFKTKGLDRVLFGLAALPDAIKKRVKLFVIGKDHSKTFQQQARELNVMNQTFFLGGRDDVPRFLLAGDLLLHPAYYENTGTVLLEAIASGLPVLTTDVCGYADYIIQAKAGKVLPSPFQQAEFNQTLQDMLLSPLRETWHQNGLNFSKEADIYSMPQRAADLIENFGLKLLFTQAMEMRGEVYRELENRRTQRVIFNEKYYFLKQHFGVGWKEIFKNLLQGRLPVVSAKNEWLALQRLEQLNIPAAKIAGYGCRGLNPATRRSFLLTYELPPHISLEDFCRDWKTTPPHFQLKQNLIKEVARIARIMHENGINHRDFYICHFLLDQESLKKNKKLILFIMDLHRAQMRKRVPERWIIKDLSGLYFSSKDIGLTQRDLLRFIKEYRNKSLKSCLIREKAFWQRIKERGNKLYRKHNSD